MEDRREIICITCPKGCRAQVWREGDLIKIGGKICKDGREYVRQEFLEPMRILTSTILVEKGKAKRLPVRTKSAVPKRLLSQCLAKIKAARAVSPVKAGDVILRNILDTGVDVVASDDLPLEDE